MQTYHLKFPNIIVRYSPLARKISISTWDFKRDGRAPTDCIPIKAYLQSLACRRRRQPSSRFHRNIESSYIENKSGESALKNSFSNSS